MAKNKFLFVEKYRPKNINEYVFKDENLKRLVNQWISGKEIPHIIFYGPAGTGKTSLIHVILNELNLHDVIEINASEETSIDVIRTKVLNFVQSMALGKFKVVILEEFEKMSHSGQSALKRVMEDNSDNARFILTTNNISRVDPAIRSRCQEFLIDAHDMVSFKIKVLEVLLAENINVTEDVLDNYVRTCYPDLRKTLNTIQQNIIDNELVAIGNMTLQVADYQVKAVELFKQHKITEARKLICSSIKNDEYEDFYNFLYKNLDLFSSTEDGQNEAIIIIAKGLVNHGISALPEITLSGTLVELGKINK